MKRDEWDVLMKLLARRSRMIPMAELSSGVALPMPQCWRPRAQLQSAISRLRKLLTEAGIEIRHDGGPGKTGYSYGLFDTYDLPARNSVGLAAGPGTPSAPAERPAGQSTTPRSATPQPSDGGDRWRSLRNMP